MNHKEILDSQHDLGEATNGFDSRSSRILVIVLGILFTIFGSAFLLLTIYDAYRIIESLATNEWFASYFSWERWLLNKSLAFLYIVSFLIGGIGLLRRKRIGWTFSIATAIFAVLNIGIMVFNLGVPSNRDYGFFGWVLLAIALFFTLITFFLLSKPVRNFFQPSLKSLGVAGIIICVFILVLIFILTYF